MRGMHAHDLPFGVVQLARLVQDSVAHAELANVVQQRGTLEPASLLGAELQLLRDHARQKRDTLAMAAAWYGLSESTTWAKAAAMSSR